jgi:predicted PurR-regulated permease PerM
VITLRRRADRAPRSAPPRAPAPEDPHLPVAPLDVARLHPFKIGFFLTVGALLAYWLGTRLLEIGSILILVLVAGFLAAGLNPMVEWLGRRGLARSWAVLAVILGVLAAVALFLVALVPVISDQVSTIVDRAPGWINQLQTNSTIQNLDAKYDLVGKAEKALTGGNVSSALFGGVVGVGVKLASFLGNLFIVIVLTLYLLATLPSVKRSIYRFAPATQRPRVTELGDRIVANVGSYVSGAALVALAAGISSLVFLLLVGLSQYAVALAAVVLILDVIPMIGATLGAVIVTLIGFATDLNIGIYCVVFYVLYQQIENYFIYPRVMSRSVNLPGAIIVVAALVGASLLGVIGALLAIPTAAAIVLIVQEVLIPRQDAR